MSWPACKFAVCPRKHRRTRPSILRQEEML